MNNDGHTPSDIAPSLPDNPGENQAMKDGIREGRGNGGQINVDKAARSAKDLFIDIMTKGNKKK